MSKMKPVSRQEFGAILEERIKKADTDVARKVRRLHAIREQLGKLQAEEQALACTLPATWRIVIRTWKLIRADGVVLASVSTGQDPDYRDQLKERTYNRLKAEGKFGRVTA